MLRYIVRHLWDYKLTLALGVFILTICLLPGMRSPFSWIPGSDKVIHGIAFAGLSLLVYSEYLRKYWALWRSELIWKPLACLLLIGIAIEWAQGALIPQRSGDIYDLTANTIGVLIGTALVYLFLLIKRKV